MRADSAAAKVVRDAKAAGARDDKRMSKAQAIKQRAEFAKRMYTQGVQFLMQHGLKRFPCEGVGDCWLISILADVDGGVPREKIGRVTAKERETLLTKRRKDVVAYAQRITEKGGIESRALTEWLFRHHGAASFEDGDFAAAAKLVGAELKDWTVAKHYAKEGDEKSLQQIMHTLTGWYLGRNVLQIAIDESRPRPGDSVHGDRTHAHVLCSDDVMQSTLAHSGLSCAGAGRRERPRADPCLLHLQCRRQWST